MSLQDVITKLTAIKEKHGNLPVVTFDYASPHPGPREPLIFIRDINEEPVCVEIAEGTKYENDPY